MAADQSPLDDIPKNVTEMIRHFVATGRELGFSDEFLIDKLATVVAEIQDEIDALREGLS